MKRIVRGHSPAEPMIPRTWSAFDCTSPISTGAIPPTSIPTKTMRAPSAAIGNALAIAAGTPAASITTSNPRPPVASAACSATDRLRLDRSRRGAELEPERAPVRLRLDQRDGAAHGGRGQRAEQADRAAADHRHLVAGVDPTCGDRGAVGDRERLDERALTEGELVGDAVEPGRLGDEVLGVGATDRESEVVVAVVDDALADHAVARAEAS